MLYLLRTDENLISVYDKLEKAISILSEIYESTLDCFIILHDDIRMKDNRKVRGRYMLVKTWLPCMPDDSSKGVIFIDETCNFTEMCTILVHEYSHHLSQEGHYGKLFNLFKDWLRMEFVKKWRYRKDAERGKDQESN